MWVQQRQYKLVGDALAAARKRARLTQQELAKRLGKPQSFVPNYEKGQRRIDVLELMLIADALGQSPTGIFASIRAGQMRARKRRE
jgi:transcriptional regulator with XRE-family HTH domain